MGRMGLQEPLGDQDVQVSKESEESQGLLASGQVFKVLKETRGSLGHLEPLAEGAPQGPVAPWGSLAFQDERA